MFEYLLAVGAAKCMPLAVRGGLGLLRTAAELSGSPRLEIAPPHSPAAAILPGGHILAETGASPRSRMRAERRIRIAVPRLPPFSGRRHPRGRSAPRRRPGPQA